MQEDRQHIDSPPPIAAPVVTAQPSVSPIAYAPPASLTPTQEAERITTLDALRGFALLGILIVNISFFANGAPTTIKTSVYTGPWIDDVATFIARFFGNYKFVSLFSLLFGMGLALQSERADQRNRPFVGTYLRRLLILLGFGLPHGILFWYGDILTLYAILGMIAMLFRHVSKRTLIATASALVLVPMLLLPALIGLEHLGAKQRSAVEADVRIEHSGDSPAAIAAEADRESRTITLETVLEEFSTIEVELYGKGPFHLSIVHRGGYYLMLSTIIGITLLGWRCLAMFLIGIAIIRSGLMQRIAEHRRTLWRWLLIATPIGLAIQLAGEIVAMQDASGFWPSVIPELSLYVGSLGLAAGYFCAICLLGLHVTGRRLLTPFAAAGRMALTNYIGQSILCGLVFYSFGLGLIGQIRFSVVLLIALAIFSLQLVLSSFWLRYFKFGPLEWLWRSLTYMKLQSMRRTATTLSLIGLAVMAIGCAPRVLLTPPTSWPVEWRQHRLYHTPHALIYATSDAAAGEADRLLNDIAAENKIPVPDEDHPAKGLVIVNDRDDEPLFSSTDELITLFIHGQAQITGADKPGKAHVETLRKRLAGKDAPLAPIVEHYMNIAPIPVANDDVSDALAFPGDAEPAIAWAGILPTESHINERSVPLADQMLDMMAKQNDVPESTTWLVKPLMPMIRGMLAKEIVRQRKGVFQSIVRQNDPEWIADRDALKNALLQWKVVYRRGRKIEDYRGAHRIASDAATRLPDNAEVLRVLAAASYRIDAFEKTLSELDRVRDLERKRMSDTGAAAFSGLARHLVPGIAGTVDTAVNQAAVGRPSDLAFRAMAAYRLGRNDEAHKAFDQLVKSLSAKGNKVAPQGGLMLEAATLLGRDLPKSRRPTTRPATTQPAGN